MGHALILAAALLALSAGGESFPVFVWCQDHAGRALPKPLLDAFGGVNIEGADAAEWALENQVDFYVGHAPGRNELHLQRDEAWYDAMWKEFYETRDASVLVRKPCLSDPATWELCAGRLDATLAARAGQHGHALSLGDEVGLTPWGDPLDLCQSPHCSQRWTDWLRERGREFEPEELAPWPTTDSVRLAYADGETDSVHDWLERRRFHQDVVLEFLTRLADRSRAARPDVPVALFGLTGQTAFGGVSIDRIVPRLDVVEAYSEGSARELLHTLRGEQRSWCTLFPAAGDSDRAAHRLWEHWLRGGDGAIVWSDRELKKNPRYLERLASAVRAVRQVHARFPEWRPRPSEVALIQDSDSTALAWLRDALSDGPTWPRRFAGYQAEHGTRERAVNGTLRLLEDAGFLPGALPLEQLDAATAQRFPVLVAVHQLVLDSEEEARLDRYLKAGGRLLLRGPFGLIGGRDQRGSKAASLAEERLRERYPRRVLRLPTDEFDYGQYRVGSPDARVGELRKEFALVLETSRKWRIESQPALPLLLAQQQLEDGSLLCAALPNLPSGPLPQVTLELQTEAQVERVFPLENQPPEQHRVRLAPGDAFVFVLRPPADGD